MSRAKDLLLVGLASASAVLAVVAWRQHRELKRLAAEVASGPGIVSPAKTIAIRPALSRGFAITPRRPAESAEGVRGLDRSTGSEGGFSPAPPRAVRRRGSAWVRLMENPEFLRALSLQRQAMLDARFAELFRKLNLRGGELAEFKRLLAEKENVALDVVTVSETSVDGPLSPELMRASVRAAQSQIEQAIHSSLGGDRYAVYREYERTLAHRATVAQLEQRLSYTGTPLTPAQADSVVRILADTTPASAEQAAPPVSVLIRDGVPEAVPILPTSGATGVTEEVVAQAQTVLAPPQIDALREIQLEQQAAMKAAQMIREVAPAATEVLPTWPTMLLN